MRGRLFDGGGGGGFDGGEGVDDTMYFLYYYYSIFTLWGRVELSWNNLTSMAESFCFMIMIMIRRMSATQNEREGVITA